MITVQLQKRLHGGDLGHYVLDMDLTIKEGERLTIYGPSGSGKTTILRMMAGLALPDKGLIQVNERLYFDSSTNINLSAQQRNIGMVFQEYCLFPNMTVQGNLKYALPKSEDENIIEELLEITELTSLKNRYPHVLSGGQKQRVALARAVVRKPEVLLLDEPFSALDSKIRKKLQAQILEFQRRFNFTAILVSHDVAEIKNLSTRVIVIENGKVTDDCPPEKFTGI